MTDRDTKATDRPVDPERDPSGNPFDHATGFSGQDYSREREAEMGRQAPSGHPLTGDSSVPGSATGEGSAGRDIPPENSQRGDFDPATGEVHGSGAGAGGGNAAEDFDEGTAGGAPEVPTGGAAPDRRA